MDLQIAAYAGSMDPITNGHLNIIERVAPLYDRLFVLIAFDYRKKYTFSMDERVLMVKSVTAHLPNVYVCPCEGRYAVREARGRGARVLIRGIRNAKDLDDELVIASVNRNIAPDIETFWVPCAEALMHVSSSMVKSHVGADPSWENEVSRLVPTVVLSQLKEKYMLSSAQKHWSRLMSSIGDPVGAGQVFGDLIARYGESHRCYHDLTHILRMLDECNRIGNEDTSLHFAIWFHDAIYDTCSKMNERQSAELAATALRRLNQEESMVKQVEELILATAHLSAVDEQKTQLLLDLDLMILGSPTQEYENYERAIRSEYAWVPENLFRTERVKVLKMFLDRPTIYSTDRFIQKFESSARSNIKNAISMLMS